MDIGRVMERDRVLDILSDCIWGRVWNGLADKTTLTKEQRDDICDAAKIAASKEYDRIMEQAPC